jgi:RimJ/RimL family protein N-acetyltransferase
MIIIRETTERDLKQVQALWADGEVMKYVGFPNGLHQSDEAMSKWLKWINEARPNTNHYSIYEDDRFCGETFYRIHPVTKRAALDIKLFPHARGKGIAVKALTYAISQTFIHGALSAWVNPDPKNEKALLYIEESDDSKTNPSDLFDHEYPDAVYFEITK